MTEETMEEEFPSDVRNDEVEDDDAGEPAPEKATAPTLEDLEEMASFTEEEKDG